MGEKKFAWLVVVVCLILFWPCGDSYAGGARPPKINLVLVPIDPSPFLRFDDYDLKNFPLNLMWEADNAICEAYKGLGGELALYKPYNAFQIAELVEFHRRCKEETSTFAEEFCKSIGPEVNVLITFVLTMDPAQISLDRVTLRILAYYKPGRLRKGQNFFSRSQPIDVSPEDIEGLHQQVLEQIQNLIQEGAKSYVLER